MYTHAATHPVHTSMHSCQTVNSHSQASETSVPEVSSGAFLKQCCLLDSLENLSITHHVPAEIIINACNASKLYTNTHIGVFEGALATQL